MSPTGPSLSFDMLSGLAIASGGRREIEHSVKQSVYQSLA
jgi:hypothetical protein